MTRQRFPCVLAMLGLLAASLMLAPVSSNASHLIVEDLASPGDGLIIRDPSTGLEWLKVTVTLGLSINDVLADPLITSGAFRYATESEVQALFVGAGLPLPGTGSYSLQSANCASAACQKGAQEIIQKFGTTNTQTPLGTLGLLDPDITAFNHYRVTLSSTGEVANVQRITSSPDTRRTGAYGTGSWLVRTDGDAVNQPPVADAGPDQQVQQFGTVVQLDGSQSYDPDGDDITYAWSLVHRPAGSFASVSDAAAVNPTFVADVQGEYRASLTVTDEFGAASAPDEVIISFLNVAPVADAGDTQAVTVGATVQLDGTGSWDANLDPLTYQWSITSQPAGSYAALSDATAPAPTFVPDLGGTYTVTLVVNDGQVDSEPDVVAIQATGDTGAITAQVTDAITGINGLAPGDFKNANMKKALTNKLAAVIADLEAGNLQNALDKLEHDVIAKTDGCDASGAPDRNDWIRDCEAQEQVFLVLRGAADLLRSLLP
jgi:hypothetical protein